MSITQSQNNLNSPAMDSSAKTFRTPKCRDKCKVCEEWSCLGQRLTTWYDAFFSAVVAVSALGAGFIFSIIFSTLETLNDTVDTYAVRHFLIIAWLLFVLAVAMASACASLFRAISPELVEGFNGYKASVNIFSSCISVGLQLLLITAFLMSAIALRKYDDAIGKVAVFTIAGFGGLLILAWIGWSL